MAAKGNTVVFPSKELKKIIDATGILTRDVSVKDMEKIEQLHIDSNGITSLAGLEHVKNLKRLTISRTKLRDITPVGQLANLEEFSLYNNKLIEDVSPLVNLMKLKKLRFYSTAVTDFSCLGQIPRLKELGIIGGHFCRLFTPSNRNTRMILNELIGDFKYSFRLSPLHGDYIRAYLYNPSQETALAALCQTPRVYPFVSAEFAGESMESVFARVFAATRVKKEYIRQLLKLELLDDNWVDVIDATGDPKAKRILFEMELTGELSKLWKCG